MNNLKTRSNKGIVTAVVALLMLSLASCGYNRTEANFWGCIFGKGPFDTRNLKDSLPPGKKTGLTNDRLVQVPADMRFFFNDKDPNTQDFGGNPIVVPAKNADPTVKGVVEVTYELQARFVINELACDYYVKQLQRIDKSEGLNFNDPGATGWAKHLNVSMNQKLINSARDLGGDYDWQLLYLDGDIEVDGKDISVLTYLGQKFGEDLTENLTKDLGGQFLCGPSYTFDGEMDGKVESCPPIEVTVKKVTPPQPLIDNLTKIAENNAAIERIESDQAKELREKQKAQALALQDQENRQETEVAAANADQAIKVARANADLAIAEANKAVIQAENTNAELKAQSDAAFCVELAKVGVDCALLKAAENGTYPQYNFGSGTATPLITLNPSPQ